nr:ATP-binding protein [Spirochaetota bacterium]
MGNILLLPEEVSSKIAAGEVVERPASVVRELIDNSVDAFSSEISVKIENGGLSRIIVLDDGTGIDKSDLALSLKKHATSKIR